MSELCPNCGLREQGLSGFCSRCDAEDAVERYRDERDRQIQSQRQRRDEWVVKRREQEFVA